jgi:PAS domain S-box-containing protein
MPAGTTLAITPYVIVSVIAAVMAAITAAVAWQRRTAPGGRPLVGLMIAVGIWSVGAALEYAAVAIPGKLFWLKLQYIGALTSPVFFLWLALEYSNRERWVTRRNLALLFSVPAVTYLVALTNERHGLIWSSVAPTGAPELNLAVYGHGFVFWLSVVGYAYALMLTGTILLLHAASQYPAPYRRQAGLVVVAALAPWAVNIVYVSGMSPVSGLELTPLVMVFTGALFTWSIFRYHLLDLAPVARERLVETMVDGMVVLDGRARVVDFNPAARRLLEAAAPIEIGKSAAALFAPWLDWNKEFGGKRTARLEFALHDAAQHYVELSIVPIQDLQGQESGRLVILHDITAVKAAQNALEELNEELEERVARRTSELLASEDRFRQVITSISDHVFALRLKPDDTVEMVYNSPRFSEMTGYPPRGTDLDFFTDAEQVTYKDDKGKVHAFVDQMREAGTADIEARVVCADGTLKWLRISGRARTQGPDRIVFAVSSDITERKQMEQIAVENRAMAAIDKLRTELVANVSHELRTPLGLIKAGSTTLLRSDVTFPQDVQQRILHGISDEADRLDHLVSNLLDISRLDQGRFFLQYQRVDLGRMLGRLVEAAEQKPPDEAAAWHTYVLRLPHEPLEAEVDVAKIEQVVRNLFENAVRYSPQGGELTIELRAIQTAAGEGASACEIRVTDQGIGIAPAERERIFERFYRSPDPQVQRIRGAGLGLAICREILRAHSGTIDVISTQGQGTTFVVCLPRNRMPSSDLVAIDEELPLEHAAGEDTGR